MIGWENCKLNHSSVYTIIKALLIFNKKMMCEIQMLPRDTGNMEEMRMIL